MIAIRLFEPGDIPAALALWAASEGLGRGPGDNPAGVARFLARNPGLSWVAVDGDTLVGAVLGADDGRRGYVYHLAVAPDYRRQGLAKELMEKSLASLRAAGLGRCLITVLTGNEGAWEFYRSL